MSRFLDRLLNGRAHHAYYPGGGYGIGRAPVLELLVPMCCSKCEEKVYEEMMDLRGVQHVEVDRQALRVIVHGFVDPHKALRKAKKVKRDSQIWNSGAQYGRDFYSSSKYRRSSYQSPSIYRTSALEYQPSLYPTSSYEPSMYRTSYNRYTPSYGRMDYTPSHGMHQPWPVYDDDMYSNVVTNPYYVKRVESEYY